MERAYAGDEPRGLLTGDELLRMPWLNPCELVGGRVIAPELVVEILSPTDRRDEVQRKLREYFAAGVRVVWVVDPAERAVRVHAAHGEPRRFAAGDVLSGGTVLPGLELPVDEAFE